MSFPSLMSRVLFAASFETLDKASWRPEIKGFVVVYFRNDQGKVALKPSLQEEKSHVKLPRERKRWIWSTEMASGLLDRGYSFKLSHPPQAISRILGNSPVSKITPLRCYFSIKSQSGKELFQISLVSFYSLDPTPKTFFILCKYMQNF